ncbi:MAG: polyphosphate kinase 2 [Candidatus Nanopelagicales bacterium]
MATRHVDRSTDGQPAQLTKKEYNGELERLQTELVHMQEWIRQSGKRLLLIFEGRDTAGKGGSIKRIMERLNPRFARIVALGVPSDREKTQWYFQRYLAHLPAAGEIVLFDRSWYNRAGVEKVMGFVKQPEYDEFMRQCPIVERLLIRDGIILIKYWLSISDEEQRRRFKGRIDDPARRWKLSPMDVEAQSRWVDYAEAKDVMFSFTDTKDSPWWVVDAEDKRSARLNLIAHLLSMVPYEQVAEPKIKLPEVQRRAYVRPPMESQTFIPQRYVVASSKH